MTTKGPLPEIYNHIIFLGHGDPIHPNPLRVVADVGGPWMDPDFARGYLLSATLAAARRSRA
jgi:hypothetical protein